LGSGVSVCVMAPVPRGRVRGPRMLRAHKTPPPQPPETRENPAPEAHAAEFLRATLQARARPEGQRPCLGEGFHVGGRHPKHANTTHLSKCAVQSVEGSDHALHWPVPKILCNAKAHFGLRRLRVLRWLGTEVGGYERWFCRARQNLRVWHEVDAHH
jgi:hypothetical protein